MGSHFNFPTRSIQSHRDSERAVPMRRPASFEADDTLVVGALQRDPEGVAAWRREVPRNRPVVVYCVHGQEVSQRTAAALRACNIDAPSFCLHEDRPAGFRCRKMRSSDA